MSEDHVELGPEPSVATFIRKIYTILEDRLFPEAIDWNSEGTALIIKKPSDFSQKVLPRYFKHNHISSFIRQLNMYGFQKKRSRHAGHVYMHELFQKGQKQLLSKIKRKVKDGLSNGATAQITPQETSTDFSMDSSILVDENQVLKGMKEEAFDKVKSLEQKVKELTAQNQKLVQHLQQQQKFKDQSVSITITKTKQEGDSLIIPPVSDYIHVKQLTPSTSYHQRDPVTKSPVKINVKQEEPRQATPTKTIQVKQLPKISPSVGMSFTINTNTFTLSEFGNKLHEVINSNHKKTVQRMGSDTQEETPSPVKKPSTYTFNYQNVKFEETSPAPTLLEKRPFNVDNEKGLFVEEGVEESINKFLRCDSPGLDLRDLGKLQSGFFSNFGDGEGRQRFDSDFDLLCFH